MCSPKEKFAKIWFKIRNICIIIEAEFQAA